MATVTIVITNDDGSVLDSTITTMPQAVLNVGMAAMAWAYGWTSTIPNPDYIASNPDSQPTIANPISEVRFMTIRWRLHTEEIALAYGASLDKQVQTNVEAIQAQISQVVVTDG